MILRVRVLLCAFLGATRLFAQSPPDISYTIRATPPTDSLGYHVTMVITHAPRRLRVAMPVWAPGAYRIANFARFVTHLTAKDDVQSLAVVRNTPSEWRVDVPNGSVTLNYDVYYPNIEAARGLGNYVFYRPDGALLGGPMTYLYIVGATHLPARVTLETPPGWNVATGLTAASDASAPHTFVAPSYDVLIDCPILIGKQLHIWFFDVDKIPHRVVYYSPLRDIGFDSVRFVDIHRQIVRAARALMGPLPYRDYSFLYEDGPGGGLEHLNSATMSAPSDRLRTDAGAIQSLTAHEYFHAWNVKRIRPVELGPFHYDRETRTSLLWWAEGVTDFFADELLRRTGLRDSAEARRILAQTIESYLNNPGRDKLSPARASWTTWDPHTVTHGYWVSYYTSGALIGELLDLRIRDHTHGARGMDDVERFLFTRYAGAHGYTQRDLRIALETICGCSVASLFDRSIAGTPPIPLDRALHDALRLAGWRIVIRRDTVDSLGHRLADTHATITSMNGIGSLGGPAGSVPRLSLSLPHGSFGKAGLVDGDFIITVNKHAITTAADFTDALANASVGERYTIDYLRAGRRRETTVTILPDEHLTVEIVDLPNITARQRAVRAAWLHGVQ